MGLLPCPMAAVRLRKTVIPGVPRQALRRIPNNRDMRLAHKFIVNRAGRSPTVRYAEGETGEAIGEGMGKNTHCRAGNKSGLFHATGGELTKKGGSLREGRELREGKSGKH